MVFLSDLKPHLGAYWTLPIWTPHSQTLPTTTVAPWSFPGHPVGDRSAPRARDSHQLVVFTRPQAQIVGLGLL